MDEDSLDLSVMEEARKRFQKAETFYGAQRQLAIADTQFVMADSDNGWQWPEWIRNQRTVDKKVMLTVNLTAQHCNQIINAIRQNKPMARVLPVDDYADKETAEILGGLLRNVQASSNADDAHDVGAEHSVYGGEGYWRIYTEYESPESFDQVIKIGPCSNPNLVYVDPDAKEIDKSDAMWGFIFEDISREQFKREYPDIDPASWDQGTYTASGWISANTVRRAEYFYCEQVKDTALLMADGRGTLKSTLPKGTIYIPPEKGLNGSLAGPNGEMAIVVRERETERKRWKWCKLVGGHDDPVDTKDWPGEYLPIVSVIGKEVNVNGEIIRKGIVRDLKDPARMVNYSYSETVQTVALQNKIPYMAAAEAIEGYEDIWKSANLENRPYLPYNAFDDAGNALPRPERQQPPIMAAAQVQLLQLSTEQMRGASGQQNSNFGIKSEAQSGIGIQRLKDQGEVATFHFPDNLRRALQYEAKVVIDLIQKIYDTKRVVRILGLDGKEDYATLDPSMDQAYAEADGIDAEDIEKIFNPLVGKYDVVINTGPAYQTQRQEAFAALTELAAKNPQLMAIAGDIVMRAADFPMAEELAKRFEKTLPPGMKDEKGNAPPPDPQAQMMIQQLDKALEGMSQDMDKLEQQLAKAELQLADKSRENEIEDRKVSIMEQEANTKARQADSAARVEETRAVAEAREPPDTEEKDADITAIAGQIAQVAAAVEQLARPPAKESAPAQAPVVVQVNSKPSAKTISIKGPSGAVYQGTVTEQVPEVTAS